MGRMRLWRIQQAKAEQQQEQYEKSSKRKELILAGCATALVLGILAWHSPDLLQSWYAREYIFPNN